MYPVSEAFHQAVASGNEQMALMIFDDCVFTNDDINISAGISFNDTFNAEQDIAIGQTISNSVSFTVFNDLGLLNSYGFGKFLATIGVKLSENNYRQITPVSVITGYAQYFGDYEPPYLLRNDSPVAVQPPFPVQSILAYRDEVWVFSGEGQFAVYDDRTGENITSGHRLNAFMKEKTVNKWSGKGIFYNAKSRILFVYQSGIRKRYEFCPLGVFKATKPNIPDKYEIQLSCYDMMQETEKDMPSASALGITYPTTIGQLYQAICRYLGVTSGTNRFMNMNATISKEPDDFENATIRTVIGWIAEASCTNARFDRDGKLCLEWLRETTQTFDEHGYATFDPYWYQTQKIDKLYVRDTGDGKETVNQVTGSAGIGNYLIQDNPLIRG